MYIYINSQFKNNTNTLQRAFSYEQRQDNILPSNLKFLLSVDRWFIEGGYFPIFKIPDEQQYIRIGNQTENINFTSTDTIYNGKFIFTIDDILNPINQALSNFNLDLTLSFDYENSLFSLSSPTSQSLQIFMNQKLGSYLLFDNMKLHNNEWVLNYDNKEIKQTLSTIDNLCPIVRISIESTDIPVTPELLPAENTNLVSRNTSNIITDFKYIQNDISPVKNIIYNADGNHRYQSMNGATNFKDIRISYFFFDYDNNKYPIMLLSGGIAESKLLFKNKL